MSALAQVMLDSADVVAATPEWQALSNTTTEEKARERIYIGSEPEPADGEAFTKAEQQERFCIMHMEVADEAGHVTQPGDGTFGAEAAGNFLVTVTRILNSEESQNVTERNKVYVEFLRLIGTVIETLQEARETQPCPLVGPISMVTPPVLQALGKQAASGYQLITQYQVSWGDVE